MPRLLLVDDNPSIHKIAETLLATSDVELVCCASGAEAMALVRKGDAFDVALLDTSMLGMDGWELLAQLRQEPATALMPVAMMAGVLDVVDPEKLRTAPIQGFLKKPVELRDLGERVQRLLETPVLPPPEPEPEPEPEPAPAPSFATTPGFQLSDHPNLVAQLTQTEDDLLILGPDDLYPGEDTIRHSGAPVAATGAFELLEEPLDLEELDLESLKGLAPAPEEEPAPGAGEVPAAESAVASEPAVDAQDFNLLDDLSLPDQEDQTTVEDLPAIPDFAPGDAFPVAALDENDDNLPELGELPEFPPVPAAPEPAAAAASADTDLFDWSDDSDSLLADLPPGADVSAPAEPAAPAAEPETIASITLSDILDPDPEPTLILEPEPEPQPEPQPELQPAAEADDMGLDIGEPLDLDLIAETIMSGELPPFADEPAVSEEPPAFSAEPPPIRDALPAFGAAPELDELPTFAAEPEPEPAALPAAEPAEALIPAFMPVPEPAAPSLDSHPDAPAAGILAEPSAEVPAGAALAAGDPLAALLADPELMERLTKAVVARLSDKALREIAWEVMPELADRLNRN